MLCMWGVALVIVTECQSARMPECQKGGVRCGVNTTLYTYITKTPLISTHAQMAQYR